MRGGFWPVRLDNAATLRRANGRFAGVREVHEREDQRGAGHGQWMPPTVGVWPNGGYAERITDAYRPLIDMKAVMPPAEGNVG